jgi:hypothetical protein
MKRLIGPVDITSRAGLFATYTLRQPDRLGRLGIKNRIYSDSRLLFEEIEDLLGMGPVVGAVDGDAPVISPTATDQTVANQQE